MENESSWQKWNTTEVQALPPGKDVDFAYKRFDISVIVSLQIIEGVLKTFTFNNILNTLLNHYGVCEASVTMTRMNAVPTISDDFLWDSQNNSNNKKYCS